MWLVPKVMTAVPGSLGVKGMVPSSISRLTVWYTLAGLYITPKGLTIVRNFSSAKRRPMLSAKHEPTKSMRSHGPICQGEGLMSTGVLNCMMGFQKFQGLL